MRTTAVLSALAFAFAASAAQAQSTSTDTSAAATAEPAGVQQRINREQRAQQRRIQAGVESGTLTAREAAQLEKGEARIDAAQHRAKADGTVTRQERKHLASMTARESGAIYRQKHDRQNDFNHNGRTDRGAAGKGGGKS
ncbi:MAG: hypothetical protein ACT4NV_00715 [Rhodoferax sp.]